MHQTKKGQQWYFSMKVHVGVDSQSKVIHTVAVTPANTGAASSSMSKRLPRCGRPKSRRPGQ